MANVKISGMSAASALTGAEAFESVQSGTTRQVVASQIKTYVDRAAYTYNVPVAGFSLTIAAGIQYLILDPAGNLANGTVVMPAAPVDGQVVVLTCTKNISTFTLSPNTGQTIANAVTSLSSGIGVSYMYRSANTTWYRVLG
jgi:hypothetical protein